MTTPNTFRLSFRDDVTLTEQADGAVRLQATHFTLPFKGITNGWRDALRRLSTTGASEQELGAIVLDQDGPSALLAFYNTFRRLHQFGILRYAVWLDGEALATLIPQAAPFRFNDQGGDGQTVYRLSRFALTRREQDQLVLESPLVPARVQLHDWRVAALVGALAQPRTCAELAGLVQLPEGAVTALLLLLRNSGGVATPGADGVMSEDSSDAVAQWEFHDLLMHSRSRLGRHTNPYGGTFPFRDRFEPLPAIKPLPSTDVVPLYRPDLTALTEQGASLGAVLERRRSIREYAAAPMTAEQLGEFLYRVARVKHALPAQPGEMEYTLRPYPGGGALYELEIYPVVNQCQRLESGLYHYDPAGHQLSKVAARTPQVEALLTQMAFMANQKGQPQVGLAITARFQRVQWKYRSMSYALILKHVGVLYQTMYLVATEMGLAPCGLGGGNSDLFAQAAGLDYYAESTVGEFILGSREATAARQHGLPG